MSYLSEGFRHLLSEGADTFLIQGRGIMAQGCLAALFGIGVQPRASRPAVEVDDSGMSEGDIHSGPGGYEGMGYSGGYASKYFADDAADDWNEGDEA